MVTRIDPSAFNDFSLKAADVAAIATTDRGENRSVHNWTARGFLTFRARSGERRLPMFSFASVVQFATLYYLSRSAFRIDLASQVAEKAIQRAKDIANRKLDLDEESNYRVLDFGFSSNEVLFCELKPETTTVAELFSIRPVDRFFYAQIFPIDYLIAECWKRYLRYQNERQAEHAPINPIGFLAHSSLPPEPITSEGDSDD